MPEETLNVLVGALAEGEIHVPRLGRIPARAGFRLIAAMNPFDAVGTARVSQAISDRMCRIAIGYQDEAGERAIVERVAGAPSPVIEPAVTLTRLTREHAQVRMGASVRGAIDLVRLERQLSSLRGEPEAVPGDATFADAAIAALSGRLRLEEGCEQTPEAIMLELIERLKPKPEAGCQAAGKSRGPAPGGAGRSLSGAAAQEVVKERGRRTLRRDQIAGSHASLEQVSPASGGSTSRPSTTCCAPIPTPPSR